MTQADTGPEAIARLRTLHGRSAAAWTGDGVLEIGASHWLALSGARFADYNLALCHGSHGADHIPDCIERLVAARNPAILSVAGEAKEAAAIFEDAHWVRVGSSPFMTIELGNARPDPAARELTADELPDARALVAEVFDLSPEIAEVALTIEPDRVEGRVVWGLYDEGTLMSCLIAMHVEDAMVVWSMATSPRGRRRGYGMRVLNSALAGAYGRGCRIGLLHASPEGEPLYLAAGYRILERWDFWSRARWVMPIH